MTKQQQDVGHPGLQWHGGGMSSGVERGSPALHGEVLATNTMTSTPQVANGMQALRKSSKKPLVVVLIGCLFGAL